MGRALVGAFTFTALMLAVALLGRHETGLPLGYFTRDPAAVMEARVYVGFVSTVGLIAWWTAAVAMAFGAWHARLRDARDRMWAFGIAAVAIAYLAIDDAFQLHEDVYLRLGISDHLVEPAYVIVTIGLVVAARRFLETTGWRLLVIAGAWFSVSVASDLATDDMRYVGFEDGAKLLGIATLAAYCLQTATRELAADERAVPAAPTSRS